MAKYIVVGGTSGIGLSVVKKLADQGHEVIVMSRESRNLEYMQNVRHEIWDVRESFPEQVDLPESIDGLIYCPGSIDLKPFRSLKSADFLEAFEVNVLGAQKLIKANYSRLKNAPSPSIVLFSTVAVQQGMPFHASVASAKGAIEGMMRSLAAEFAPNIRVNCIAPSLTDTPMAHHLLSNDRKREAAEQRHPLRRYGRADDMANAVNFLLSPENGWITGQVFNVDGGLSTVRV